jgi:hypothetical protein
MSMLPDFAGVPTSRRAVPGFGGSALQERGSSDALSQGLARATQGAMPGLGGALGRAERGNSLARLTQGSGPGPLALNPLAANPLGAAGMVLTDSLSRAAGSAMQRLGGGPGRWLLQWGGWGMPDTENDTKVKANADTANSGFTEMAYGGARIIDARHSGTASITSAGFDAFGTAFPHTRKGEWPAPSKASQARSGNFAT